MRTRLLAAIAVTATLGLAACGGGGGGASSPTTSAPTTASDSTAGVPARPTGALVARSTGADVPVYSDPSASEATSVVPAFTEFGFPSVFLVLEESDDRLHVLLPTRPNGATGWIARDALELREVDAEVRIDLTARTLQLVEAGAVIVETPIAIGAPDAPTPTGRFYVTDLLDTGEPDGPYGPYAVGLSGHSDVLTDFGGGDGQVGIHGTNDPSSIGQAVSHGCIRVPNEIAAMLATSLPLGTPVVIA